jgi:pyruvate dehydrogenase E1 component alpha subunit
MKNGVYEPREDSLLLEKYVKKFAKGIVLDIGTGSGIQAKAAAERARNDSLPTFLECMTYKMKGHGVYDKGEYRPKEEVAKWLERDPVATFKKRLVEQKIITKEEVDAVDAATQQEIEEAVKFAMQGSPLPFDEIQNYVYAK